MLLISCKSKNVSKSIDISKEEKNDNQTVYECNLPSNINNGAISDLKIDNVKVIRRGEMDIEVTNFDKSIHDIQKITEKYKGYIGKQEINKGAYRLECDFIIYIPASSFIGIDSEIEKIAAQIKNKSMYAEDITTIYMDNESRIHSKKMALNQYYEILKKAKSVEEILLVQEQIRLIEEEIESNINYKKEMDSKIEYSQLQLHLSKEIGYTNARKRFGIEVQEALKSGWDSIIEFTILILRLWPIWLILIPFTYWLLRFIKHKKVQQKTP